MSTVLITGIAGFIGYHTVDRLLKEGHRVIGVDSLEPYYDINLKKDRLNLLKGDLVFHQKDLSDPAITPFLLETHPDIDYIIHLAAQPGVRYSTENPHIYITCNITAHLNVLEIARHLKSLKHMVYASSSSVYGANKKLPYSVTDRVDHPVSLYAATKRADELLSESYYQMYKIPVTCLRYFTVYGPWGRPDMSPFIFANAIHKGLELPVFNNGEMRRNFTYVSDIVQGTCLTTFSKIVEQPDFSHRIYNIGNDKSETLMDYIQTFEKIIGKKANIKFMPLQTGDVQETVADIRETTETFGYQPTTDIYEGLKHFNDWYVSYYKE